MSVIDFHSHILPGIDDGSRNVPTSLKMLELSAEQNVEIMVATPHFYAWQDRIDSFLQRRAESWDSLLPALTPALPRIVLGAEVAFFPGISTAEQIQELTISGTRTLLLEMPFRPWSERDVEEVQVLLEQQQFRIVLAHLERYLPIPGNKKWVSQLLELPVTVQINAQSLLDWRQRGRLIRMFRSGQAHLLGSDCHGLRHRVPNLGDGRAVLEKKLGPAILRRIDGAGALLLPEGVTYVQ